MSFSNSSGTAPHPRRRNAHRLLRHSDLGTQAPVVARLSIDSSVRGETGIVEGSLGGLLDKNTAADHSWSIIPVRLLPPQAQSQTQTQTQSHAATTIHIPGSASSLQSFLKLQSAVESPQSHTLRATSPCSNQPGTPKLIDCLAIDVVPVGLETIYVTVERHLISNLDETQNAYAGGFASRNAHTNAPLPKKSMVAEREERLKQLVRKALGSQQVVRAGAEVSLSLPPHPITYAPAPPAKVAACEPVAQGLLMPRTRIVLVQTKPTGASNGWRMAPRGNKTVALSQPAGKGTATQANSVGGNKAAAVSSSSSSSPNSQTANDSGTSDVFYFAPEVTPTPIPATMAAADRGSEADKTVHSDADETYSSGSASATDLDNSGSASDSDDSLDDMDDMISLAAPELMNSPSTLSTPRASSGQQGPQPRVFDVHTPRSYLSSSTARASSGAGMMGRSKIFRPESLVRRVPLEFLHPRPGPEEDEDAVMFVDVQNLAKIGCFSGDWVRVEANGDSEEDKFARGVNGVLSNLKTLRLPGGSNSNGPLAGPVSGGGGSGTAGEEFETFRVVRVYGIAGLSGQQKQRLPPHTRKAKSPIPPATGNAS
ncbi:peroxisomal assembly protein, partial [Ascosphaera aggregata]